MKSRIPILLALLVYLAASMGIGFHSHSGGGYDQIGVHCKICQVSQVSAECPGEYHFGDLLGPGFVAPVEMPLDFSPGILSFLQGRAPPVV